MRGWRTDGEIDGDELKVGRSGEEGGNARVISGGRIYELRERGDLQG